jgi:hypothetical protein
MLIKITIGSLFLGFTANASDFSERILEASESAQQGQSELAQQINERQPMRNRAGRFYFPGKDLSHPDAQALLMVRLLNAKDSTEIRVSLAYALDSTVLIPWSHIAEEPEAIVRAAMLHLTKHNKSPESAKIVKQALNDSAPEVRIQAARLAGYVQATPHLNHALITSLKDSSGDVRAFSARSLGWQGNTASFEAIRVLLRDPEAHVRDRALQALAVLDTPRTQALPELIGLQKDSHSPLARRAKQLSK